MEIKSRGSFTLMHLWHDFLSGLQLIQPQHHFFILVHANDLMWMPKMNSYLSVVQGNRSVTRLCYNSHSPSWDSMHAQPYLWLSAQKACPHHASCVSELYMTHQLHHTASAHQSDKVRSCHRAQCIAIISIHSEFCTGFRSDKLYIFFICHVKQCSILAVTLSIVQHNVCSNILWCIYSTYKHIWHI